MAAKRTLKRSLTSAARALSDRGLDRLKALGSGPRAQPARTLETFANPNPERDYAVHMRIPEFTCLCPKTGQPDFATLHLDYVPDAKCVELKSLKLYIWSFRNEGRFHEAVTNEILGDLVAATKPRFMRLTAKFLVRGGIYTTVVTEHRKRGWNRTVPGPAGNEPGPRYGEDPV